VAASGGYYISAPANVITANTITSSIGVFSDSKRRSFNNKLGITFDAVKQLTQMPEQLFSLSHPATKIFPGKC